MDTLKEIIEFFGNYPTSIKIIVPLLIVVAFILLAVFSPQKKSNSKKQNLFNKTEHQIQNSKSESEILDLLEEVFLIPDFNSKNNINWEYFSYTIINTRNIVQNTVPLFKKNASIKNAFIIVNGFLIELQGNAERVYGNEFSIENHYKEYGESQEKFINNLPARKNTQTIYNGIRKYSYDEYAEIECQEIIEKMRYVLSNIFNWKIDDKISENSSENYSPPPHFSSIWDEAAYSANIREFSAFRVFGLRWIGDGAYIEEKGESVYPAAIILKNKNQIVKSYGHDCIINFDLELKNTYKWAKIERIFVKVTSFRELSDYELLLPNPFEESNVYYIQIDNPENIGNSEFEAKLFYNINGNSNNFGEVRLYPNQPESFTIRIDAKSIGLYKFDLYCSFHSDVNKELICVFKEAEYAFVTD